MSLVKASDFVQEGSIGEIQVIELNFQIPFP